MKRIHLSVTDHEPRHKDEPVPEGYDWALRGVDGNVTTTGTEVQAWFVMHAVDWNYRSNPQCEVEIDHQVRYLVALTGRDCHMLSMPMPYPVSAWARNLDLNTPHPVDEKAWNKHLRTKQASLRGGNLGENITLVGVTLGGRNYLNAALDRFRPGAEREAQRLAGEINVLTEALSHAARPAEQREVEWMLHQTRGVGLPTPMASPVHGNVPMDQYDLAGIYESVEVMPGNIGARATHLVGSAARGATSAEVERWVSVVAMGRTEALTIPEKHHPWLAYAQQFPGVITSVRFNVVSGPEAAKAIESKIRLVQDQAPQYQQHGLIAPPNLGRTLASAVALQDEMQEAHASNATRVIAWVRFALSAPTRAEVLTKVQQFKHHMEKYNVAIEHPRAQEALYREFTPGEPLATTAHRRVMRVRLFAAAIPQVSSTIGDRQGLHFGKTVGVVSSPFMWDTHRGMEVLDAGGFTPVVGEMGSGKSTFIGGCAALSAFRGIHTTVLDPSGLQAKIAQWSPIRDHTEVIDLLSSNPGSLSPFSVVPEPRIEHARQDPKVLALPEEEREEAAAKVHADNVAIAQIERKALAVDVLRGCLPTGLNRDPKTEVMLMQAVAKTGGNPFSSLSVALDALAANEHEHAQTLHTSLREIAQHPYARLFLGAGYMAQYGPDTIPDEKTLLIITMSGLVLPDPHSDRDTWSLSERLAVPLLSLAAHHTSSRIYRRPMSERKVLTMDEFHFFGAWPSGRALTARLERDSRKWNLRVFAASQDTVTAMSSQKASSALVSDALIFNVSANSPEQQAAALKILDVPVRMGYEKVLSSLRPTSDGRGATAAKWRDAMVRINGKPGRVRFDFGDEPELRDLLITTPTSAMAEGSTATGREWFAV